MTSRDFGRWRKTVILCRRRLISGRELMNLRKKRGVLFLNRAGSSVHPGGQHPCLRSPPSDAIRPSVRACKSQNLR
ncbi:hypothetical protein LINPERHAP2_LOCUS33128 [Linum perenne]